MRFLKKYNNENNDEKSDIAHASAKVSGGG